MSKKKPIIYNPLHLIEIIEKWPNPVYDKKHGYYLYVEGRARSNQTRIEHIVEFGHDLKVKDLMMVPTGIANYFDYRKDPVRKSTYNYYLKRKGIEKGFVKISIQIDHNNPKKAWIKTIYITYKKIINFKKVRYNEIVRGGEPVCDHDAFLRKWMQRSGMLTAPADEKTLEMRVFFLFLF